MKSGQNPGLPLFTDEPKIISISTFLLFFYIFTYRLSFTASILSQLYSSTLFIPYLNIESSHIPNFLNLQGPAVVNIAAQDQDPVRTGNGGFVAHFTQMSKEK